MNFLERLAEGSIVFDGAMGTELYARGAFLNTCYDELNLTRPDLIGEIHLDYVAAGADIIETNTFGANRYKLKLHGLAEKVDEINAAAVKIARKAIGEKSVLVAGAIGPIGVDVKEDLAEIYKEQITALVNAKVDLLIFETFTNGDELLLAVKAAKEVSDTPVIAQITVCDDGKTTCGNVAKDVLSKISKEENVAAVGLNCSTGPALLLKTLESLKGNVSKPLSIQPNAGYPRLVEGRMIYMATPEYMAEYAKRYMAKGATIFGGCCGTNPEHIREMSRIVHAVHLDAQRFEIKDLETSQGVEQMPLAEKSSFGQKIADGIRVESIEITPPRGWDLTATIDKARVCAKYNIDAINIPDGPRASSRLSPQVMAVEIERQVGIETVLHVCCRDRNIIGMQADMLGAQAAGLRNLLIVTGDPPKLGEYPDATAVFDIDAIGFTRAVKRLNCGVDVGGNPTTPPTSLVLGVGVNPVAVDMELEKERFALKVEAGAEFAITQPVFDVKALRDFLKWSEQFNIPILAGVWPFTSYKNAEFMATEVPGVVVPDSLLSRMRKTATREEGRAEGVKISKEIISEIEDVCAGMQISAPFGNVHTALAALGHEEL